MLLTSCGGDDDSGDAAPASTTTTVSPEQKAADIEAVRQLAEYINAAYEQSPGSGLEAALQSSYAVFAQSATVDECRKALRTLLGYLIAAKFNVVIAPGSVKPASPVIAAQYPKVVGRLYEFKGDVSINFPNQEPIKVPDVPIAYVIARDGAAKGVNVCP